MFRYLLYRLVLGFCLVQRNWWAEKLVNTYFFAGGVFCSIWFI